MGVSFTNLKCHVATVPMRVYVTPSQRWKLPVENYECTIKENEGEGEGHGSDVNGTEDVNGTGDEVDEDRQTQTPSQRKRQKKKEERPSRTESGPLDASWPSGWQPRQQGVGLRSSRDQAPRLARSSARSRVSDMENDARRLRRAGRLSRDKRGRPGRTRRVRVLLAWALRRSLRPHHGPAYILVGRLLVQQWPSNRQLPRRPRRQAAPPPATQLAALAPPSQQPTLALAAAARATLDPSELQEFRGSKREALARTPPSAPPPERPPPAESRKKTRGTGALQAALAAAAPAAAAPQPPTATSPLAPALLADANPFRLLA